MKRTHVHRMVAVALGLVVALAPARGGENSRFAGLADQTAAAPGNPRIQAVPVLGGRALEDLVWSWGNSEKPAGTPGTRRL